VSGNDDLRHVMAQGRTLGSGGAASSLSKRPPASWEGAQGGRTVRGKGGGGGEGGEGAQDSG